MPTQTKSTISNQISSAYQAINYTMIISDIQTLVAVYGYTPDKMQEGKQLYEVAAAAVAARNAAVREQRYATERAQKAHKAARASYQLITQMARAVFGPGSAEYRALGLVGGMPRTTTKFMTAAVALFNNALTLPEAAAGLASYGFDATRLERERESITAFAQAQETKIAAVKAARLTTPAQTEALAALHQWLVQYHMIARIALEGRPWMLKGLMGRPRKATSRKARAK